MAELVIEVSPELLRGKAKEVRDLKADHDDAIARLTSLVQNLNEIWKGKAQTDYVTEFESMKGTFEKFSNLLEKYANLMDDHANEMEGKDLDQSNKIVNTLQNNKFN